MEQNNQKKSKTKPPFEGPYITKPVAVAGKKGLGYSSARHLARMGMKKAIKEDNEGISFKELRANLTEKKLTSAEKKKREEVAKAIERENPNMPMGMKMAIATSTAKRVAEDVQMDEEKDYTSVHRVGVTYSDPNHPAVSMRKSKVFKNVRVRAQDEMEAKNSAIEHFKRKGMKVHGAEITTMKEEIEQISELSPQRMSTYTKAAQQDMARRASLAKLSRIQKGPGSPEEKTHEFEGQRREKGLEMAMKKMKEEDEGEHFCAKHVRSNLLGDGVVLEAQHADPDAEGNIEWYMVEFKSGTHKVFTEDLEIMVAEYHGNHKKKKRMTNG